MKHEPFNAIETIPLAVTDRAYACAAPLHSTPELLPSAINTIISVHYLVTLILVSFQKNPIPRNEVPSIPHK
jgi:hypothetical protein